MPEKRWPSRKKWGEEELDDVRSRNPNLPVMAMADGSWSLWSHLPTLDADEETVDFYHASEYLEDAQDCLMGANSPTTDERYVERRHAQRQEPFGADKVLVSDRLKRSGMSWSLAGGQATLNVRALVQSDRCDRTWDLVNGSTLQIAA